MKSSENRSVRVSDIQVLSELNPMRDERLLGLLNEAISGQLPVYHAAVPLALCIPFDVDYRPDMHPVGAMAIRQVIEESSHGQFTKLLVYQRGRWFVVSDDYIPLFAALVGLPEYVSCWVLGKPVGDLVRDVQGPVDTQDIRRILLGQSRDDEA